VPGLPHDRHRTRHHGQPIDETEILAETLDNPGTLRRYQHRLSLLPDSLPFWHRVMRQNWRDDLSRPMGYRGRAEQASTALLQAAKARELNPDDPVLAEEISRLQAQVSAIQREFEADVRGESDRGTPVGDP
jgi:hypothetical protein